MEKCAKCGRWIEGHFPTEGAGKIVEFYHYFKIGAQTHCRMIQFHWDCYKELHAEGKVHDAPCP